MPSNELEARLARIEVGAAATGHVGVIVYGPNDDPAALVAAAERAGRIAPNYGVLVLPDDVADADLWEALSDA